MNLQALRYAIEDAKRFATRAEEVARRANAASVTDAEIKTVKRLSLDVTHAMKDLRDSIETKAETE